MVRLQQFEPGQFIELKTTVSIPLWFDYNRLILRKYSLFLQVCQAFLFQTSKLAKSGGGLKKFFCKIFKNFNE